MPTPEPTSLTPQQQQRAEALAIVRRHFALPGGFTGMSREKLSAAVANPVIALAEWILEERPARGETVTPGDQETPYEHGEEVWTVGHGREPRQWFVDQRGAWFEADPDDPSLRDRDEPPVAEVLDEDPVRPNAGPCPICDEVVALPLLAGHLKLHEDTEVTDRG